MNLGFPEMIFLFLFALILFGPKKLPEIGRQIGRALNEFKRASNEFKAQIESEISQLDLENNRQTILPPVQSPMGSVASSSFQRPAEISGQEVSSPALVEPQIPAPAIPHPQTAEPQISEPQTSELQASEPETSEYQASAPLTSEPQTSEPEIPEPRLSSIQTNSLAKAPDA